MGYNPLVFSGLTIGSSGGSSGPSINGPIAGSTPHSVLKVNADSTLGQIGPLLDGQLIIGSTGAAPAVGTLGGTTNQVIVTNATGSITLSLPQSISTSSSPTFASLILSNGGSVSSSGSLLIGNNATSITIGNAGATVTVLGTTVYENVTQWQLTDKLITVNKGGAASSGSLSGIETEENGSITAYNKTSSDRLSQQIKVPASVGVVSIVPGATDYTIDRGSHEALSIGIANGLSLSGIEGQTLDLQLASTSQTGALSSTDFITFNNKQPAGNYITALTGDVSASGPGSASATLATVNSNIGSFGSASSSASVTVNAKGLVTAASETSIQIAESQVTNLVSDLALKAPLASPTFTGSPLSTTPPAADSSTRIATTAFVQGELGNYIPSTEKGANNGVATLDAGGKVPVSQLPNSIMEYKGNYNAATNSPTLIDGTGNAGDVYRVNVAGTQDFGSGNITFAIGDWVVYNGSIWEKSINSNSVVSVNGQQGVVVLSTTDISEGSNLYFTDSRAQTASVVNTLAGNETIKAPSVASVNTALAGKQATGNYITALTGDATASGPGSATLTLATVNSNVGTFGTASSVSTIIVNAKGLVTAASETSIQIAQSQVTDLVSDLALKAPLASPALTGNPTAPTQITGNNSTRIATTAFVQATVAAATVADATTTTKGIIKLAGDLSGTADLPTVPGLTTKVDKVTGDIVPTTYTGIINNTANQNIIGLSFANSVKSFEVIAHIFIDATTDTYTTVKLIGTNKSSDWSSSSLIKSFSGDVITGLDFSVNTLGQVLISIGNITGFSASSITFRASVV